VTEGVSRPRISGVVICMNEERNIDRCLASLDFCDEIVVVDSGSTDRTPEIARRHATHVVEQPFLGYVKQKNFALERATGDWVVCLDADEALSDELRAAIPEAICGQGDRVAGFVLDRVTWFLGVWHDAGEWYPDPQLRVFRRELGHWTGRDPHDRVLLRGPSAPLSGHLYHWNYRDLSDHIRTVDRFSARQAQGMHEEGLRFRLWDLLARPPFRFVKGYVLRGGFRKGLAGFLVSVSTAYYVMMKYAKLWELERAADFAAPPATRRESRPRAPESRGADGEAPPRTRGTMRAEVTAADAASEGSTL
jgi:glycosyltransferase involved in cell wall biosynthesis